MSEPSVSTEAVMDEVRGRVRAELYERLVAEGAGDDFENRGVFEEVDRLFVQALAHEHPQAEEPPPVRGRAPRRGEEARLLLPTRIADPWRPALSLDFPTHHRGLAGRLIPFAKAHLVLPVVRWLYEYANENFRRQHQVNVALMACLQALAADHARLKARLAEVERRDGRPSR